MVTLKPSMPQLLTATALLGVGVYLSFRNLNSDAQVALVEAEGCRLSDRSLVSSRAADGVSAIVAEADSQSPRVSSRDSAPSRVVDLDAPAAETLAAKDDSVSILQSGKKAPISGLRYRLLMEAAGRALHSLISNFSISLLYDQKNYYLYINPSLTQRAWSSSLREKYFKHWNWK
ncbi:hypothetical protein N9A89_02155 [Akkermansiaceae bacterium]|nr:hypothetical protein [Akkermansiaceae bacterium]